MAPFWTVHAECLKISYKTRICSKATLFYVICVALTVVLPFLVAYSSQGFWKRVDTYQEQPDIHWKHELLVLLETVDDTKFITWSTYPHFNNLLRDKLRIPIIKSREEDKNGDGKNEELILRLEFPVTDTENIVSVKIILIFDYKINKFSRLEMESLAYFDYNSPRSGSELNLIADLSFHQNVLLRHTGVNLHYNKSVIDRNSVFAEAYSLPDILKSYSGRDVTTVLENVYRVWTSGRGPNQPFVITANIRYPEQNIQYRPGFWHVMKTAWIQYLSILIVFMYIFSTIKTHVFSNRIIHTIVENQYKNHKR